MPRFYFDTIDSPGPKIVHDDVGVDLPDAAVAREQALAYLGEHAKDELPDGDEREFVVRVRSAAGPLLTARLALKLQWDDGEGA